MRVALIAVVVGFCAPEPQAGVAVDKDKKTIRVPCKIAPRKLPNLTEIYPIEVVSCWPTPKGQKAHETIVIFDVMPSDVHKALESLGLKAGKPGRGDDLCSGPEIEIYLELPSPNGQPPRVVRIESTLIDKKTGRTLPPIKWHFTGSVLKEGKYAADQSGTMIGLYPVTDEVVMQSALTMREEGLIKLETAKNILPPEGTPVTLIIKPAAGPPPAAVGAPDPEKQVLKLSKTVGPAEATAPAVAGGGSSAPAPAATDPFEHRKEIRAGKGLPDSSRPVDLPKQ
jgi:hypothetical protein